MRPLYNHYGDYASVYLDVSRAAEDAAKAIELRWRSARERLAQAGADETTLAATAGLVTDAAHAAPGIAVFARKGEVAMSARLRTAPRHEIAAFAPIPHALPLLAQRPPRVPHLRVTAGLTGGDILAITGTGRVLDERRVHGGWPRHKSSEGRTSNQHGPEAEWEAAAHQLADQAAAAAAEVHAEHLILAGDPRARSSLLDHLKPALRDITVVVDAEVLADSAVLAEAAEKISTQYSERTSVSHFETWHARMADSGAVAGLAPTVAALADGRAAEVFIADRPQSTATLWTGPGGADLAVTRNDLIERGIGDPVRDRADAAIARGIACTDAELFFLPDGAEPPADGIGAILRY